ncbi:MAG: nucleotide exchange factor GrpE [Baekduia sp.]
MTTDDHEHASDEIGSAPTPESEVPDADEALDADVAMAVDADGDEPSVPEEPDYQDLYLRAAAETENVRKRARRDVEVANARGVAKLARELLPALDNLDRALAAAESEDGDEEHHMTKGVRLVQQELLAALTRVGIEPFSPDGEQFDPHQHEAMAQVAVDGAETGTIVQVFQAGYRYKDEVLRPARVAVAP